MSRVDSNAVLSVVHHHCCGLDIHKDKVSAAVITTHDDGTIEENICEFGAFTEDLYRLKDWVLVQSRPPHQGRRRTPGSPRDRIHPVTPSVR